MQNAWQPHTHAQSGPMFQLISAQHHPTTEKLQKCLVSHWFHSHGKQNQKANFLATLAQNTNFSLCARERKRQPGHNENNDLLPGQWRHAWSISSNLPLMFFFFCACTQFGTHNSMDAFIQRNFMSAYFQRGWLQQGSQLQPWQCQCHVVCCSILCAGRVRLLTLIVYIFDTPLQNWHMCLGVICQLHVPHPVVVACKQLATTLSSLHSPIPQYKSTFSLSISLQQSLVFLNSLIPSLLLFQFLSNLCMTVTAQGSRLFETNLRLLSVPC